MGTKGGQNCYQLIHYDVLSCQQVSFTLPQETPSWEEHKFFQETLVLFGAIQQRRSSDAAAVQCRCIPKCAVKTSAVIITASELQGCSCAASLYPKMSFFLATWWKVSLANFLLNFFRAFKHQSFAPIGLQKKNTAAGWLVQKYLSVNYIVIFLTSTDAVTKNPHINIWPLRIITNPTGWDSVKVC
jgi:hypothetical protein